MRQKDECGIIFDIDHFAAHDGPGIRTVVYFKGCPLKCVWCHSPESQKKEPQMLHFKSRCKKCPVCMGDKCANGARAVCGKLAKASELADEISENKIFFDSSGGGATISGGEALFQPKFAISLLALLRERKIHSIVETCGMGNWEHLREIAEYADIFYYDIKILDEKKHLIYTGAKNKTILGNLKKLAGISADKITLRVPLIPGYNDFADDIAKIYDLAHGLCIRQIHLLKYNSSAPAKYEWLGLDYKPGDLKKQSEDYLGKLRKMAPKGLDVFVF